MSTRQLLTKTTGALGLLAVVALVAVVATLDPGGGDADAAALAVRQQGRVADLDRQLEALVAAEDMAAVNTARQALGRTVLDFDRALDALVHGGNVAGEGNRPRRIGAVRGTEARQALAGASAIWRQVGPPLADLAAGEFSVFSAAGQQALRDLRQGSLELSAHLAQAAAACAPAGDGPGRAAMAARLLAGACLLALAGALALRRRALRPAAPAGQPAPRGLAPAGAVSRWSAAEAAATPAPRPAAPALPYKSPVDFEDVAAAVDQMTVDMSTIATSTEKMRAAIDSVGVALQGMIYRLQDLGDDTAEGYRLVRGANNAAGYTAQVAAELAESVKEMGNVVSRVTRLAQNCRHTAAAIDQEAEQTGRTGAAFTDAVSGQVKTLAAQTANATAEIEHTVSQMLARTREYEEAVGQILKHVSAIHKVSRHLGQVVLDPPASAVVGAPRPRTRVLEPAAAAAYAPDAAEPADLDDSPEPTADEWAARTAEAIEDAAGPQAAPAPTPQAAAAAPPPPPPPAADAADDEMPAYTKPKVTFSLDDHGADTPPPAAAEAAAPAPARPSVFMLNRPKPVVADLGIPGDAPAAEPSAPAAPAPAEAAATAPDPALDDAAASFGASVGPVPAPEPAAAPPADPAAEAETGPLAAADGDAGSEPAVSDGPRPNIFMLNDPGQTPKPRVSV